MTSMSPKNVLLAYETSEIYQLPYFEIRDWKWLKSSFMR